MNSKYPGVHHNYTVKKDVIKYFTLYEDYVIKYQRGFVLGKWPKKTKDQYEHIFDRLTSPWKLIDHGSYIYTIKSPYNIIEYRAIDMGQLFKAIDKIYKRYKNYKTKPWALRLDAKEVARSFRTANKGAMWVPKDYEIVLAVCINIISTWNTRTGDWKPWSNYMFGSWPQLVHDRFQGDLKYGYAIRENKNLLTKAYYRSISHLNLKKPITRDVKFSDITNFIFAKAERGHIQAAFILGSAFITGGSRAGRIIGSFCQQYHIPIKGIKHKK